MPTEPLNELRADIHEIKTLLTLSLHSDPGNGRPGVYIRLDRLEQQCKQMAWAAATSLTAAAAALVTLITSHK